MSGSVAPRQAAPFDHGDARTALVYIADQASNLVVVFDRNGTETGTIASGLDYPQGLFVDGKHNLWVANRGASNVLEFARGASTPRRTLSDPGAQPEDVTICPNGTVYVANILTTSGGGNIAVYAGGSLQPTGTLSYDLGNVFYVTCDAVGNVFAGQLFGSNGTVVEFPGGQQSGATMLPIFTGGNPGGIKPDAAGNLLFSDSGGSVTEYTEAGTPTGNVIHTGGGWTDIALDRKGNVVLGADGSIGGGASLEFPSGAHRPSYKSIHISQPTGAAFDPGQEGI
jgi:hypothetical protein